MTAATDRWSNYIVTAAGCWEWQGYADPNGYGRIYDAARPKGQKIQWAHRAFYERFREPIEAGYQLDHTCCNTICVNPEHLDQVTSAEHCRRTLARLGKDDKHLQAAELRMLGLTYAEIAEVLGYTGKNGAAGAIRAAIEKGLVVADALPAPSPLTEAEREDIRALNAMGIPQQELVAWYGVDNSHISRICNRKDSRGRSKPPQDAEGVA